MSSCKSISFDGPRKVPFVHFCVQTNSPEIKTNKISSAHIVSEMSFSTFRLVSSDSSSGKLFRAPSKTSIGDFHRSEIPFLQEKKRNLSLFETRPNSAVFLFCLFNGADRNTDDSANDMFRTKIIDGSTHALCRQNEKIVFRIFIPFYLAPLCRTPRRKRFDSKENFFHRRSIDSFYPIHN